MRQLKNKVLKENAIKRLNAIKEFTELGSGYALAVRDLSIRGAGDILGSEQAGFIDSVGIDLYLKLLNDEVERKKGNLPPEENEEDSEDKPLLSVNTHIEDDYVSEDDKNAKEEVKEAVEEKKPAKKRTTKKAAEAVEEAEAAEKKPAAKSTSKKYGTANAFW